VGILFFSLAGSKLKLCSLPSDIQWKHIAGVGFLGGIGFTMSIFIALLAFDKPQHVDIAKIAILIASAVAGIIGFFWLRKTLPINGVESNK
jgi:NhaA family Na+:H+ antiporter